MLTNSCYDLFRVHYVIVLSFVYYFSGTRFCLLKTFTRWRQSTECLNLRIFHYDLTVHELKSVYSSKLFMHYFRSWGPNEGFVSMLTDCSEYM